MQLSCTDLITRIAFTSHCGNFSKIRQIINYVIPREAIIISDYACDLGIKCPVIYYESTKDKSSSMDRLIKYVSLHIPGYVYEMKDNPERGIMSANTSEHLEVE